MTRFVNMDAWWEWNLRMKPFTDHLVRYRGYPFYGLQYLERIGYFSSMKGGCIMLDQLYRN